MNYRRTGIRALLALTLALAGVWVQAAPPKTVVTTKNQFRIPFRLDPQLQRQMQVQQLQLFVSRDGGRTWQFASAISPQETRFEFQAPDEGEYLFSTKMLDVNNQLHPPGEAHEPGLRVVVDHTLPKLDVRVELAAKDKIRLTWNAEDPNLDISTLKLEYTQPQGKGWESVSIVPRPTGSTSWSIREGGLVSVRGVVRDSAGNEATAEHFVRVDTPGQSPVFQERPPIASTDSDIVAVRPRSQTNPLKVTAQNVGLSQAASNSSPMPSLPEQPTAAASSSANSGVSAVRRSMRVVNTRQFTINYRVDDIGPSGLGEVDLYVTEDQGKRWFRYGEDADRVSPFQVEVPNDGRYGFTIRVRSGAGLGFDPPVANEPPAMTVVVDQTPPQIELFPIQQGQGNSMNQLQIRWRTVENNPSEKGVMLQYATTPSGPWEPITDWREDTGAYLWSVGSNVPWQIYVRVTVRDEAGNSAQADSPKPITIDLSRPSAKIVDIESASSLYAPR